MNVVHLPLNRLLQGLVWSSNNWSPSDHPYFSHDWFEIAPIFLSLVVSRLLLYSLASLIAFLNKLLEFPPLDQLLCLLFQILAFICIMTMVFMDAVVPFRISLLWWCLQTTFASLRFCKIIFTLLLLALGLYAFIILSLARQSLCSQRIFPIHVFLCFKHRSVIEVGGVFLREKMRSGLISPAWKVVIMTCSSASSISMTSLLNRFTYSFRVSPS